MKQTRYEVSQQFELVELKKNLELDLSKVIQGQMPVSHVVDEIIATLEVYRKRYEKVKPAE